MRLFDDIIPSFLFIFGVWGFIANITPVVYPLNAACYLFGAVVGLILLNDKRNKGRFV